MANSLCLHSAPRKQILTAGELKIFFVYFSFLDRVKMYQSQYLDPDYNAESLQRKVQFDIQLYFARRGCENMEKMMRDHFKLEFDTKSETWYVIKNRDELTKNHKDVDQKISGIMPENKDDCLCPVRSYQMYIEKLNPDNPYLWQVPLTKVDPMKKFWYGLQHQGKHTLGKFMTDISTHCGLSKKYTNNSIRVTGITILTRMQFSTSEIMSVSGHKSVQSLTNYQCTQPHQKINMGKVLYQSMTREEDKIKWPQLQQNANIKALQFLLPEMNAIAPVHVVEEKQNINPSNALVPFEPNFEDQEVPDFDLMSILNDMEEENPKNFQVKAASDTTCNSVNMMSNVINNVPKSMFSYCTIQNVTFNMPK